MWDVGLHPCNVLRPWEACQSCLIIASINLICAWEDKVWPLLYVIVWLACLIHDPTAQATGKKQLPKAPEQSVVSQIHHLTFLLSILCFLSVGPAKLPQVLGQNSDLCFIGNDLFCVVVLWNDMTNKKSKVMDRGLLIYNYNSWQQIYSIPMLT